MTLTAYDIPMRDQANDDTLLSPLSLYNILEAFLAGTSDGFMVLDSDGKVILFNQKFEEFVKICSAKNIQQFDHFVSFLNDAPNLFALADAVRRSYKNGASHKFSFSVPCDKMHRRWFDAEVHPLKNNERVVGLGIGIFETTEKKEAEETIKKSEALFKALVQNSTDVFVLSDEQFEFKYVSDAVHQVLGYEPSDLVGKPGIELVHPDDRAGVEHWFKKLLQQPGQISVTEFRVKNGRGAWIYSESFGQNLLNDPHVASIVISWRNVHAKKIADLALIQAEQRLTQLLNNTKESFIILNNRLRIAAYNKAAQESSPYFLKNELQSGFSILDLVKSNEIAEYIEMFEGVMEGNERERDTTFIDNQGKLHIYKHIYRRMELENDMQGIFITSTDITEQREAELALVENEERFRTIIQYSFDAIMIVDEQANMTYISPSISSLMGFAVEELINKSGFEFIHPDDIQDIQEKFQSILHNQDETYADYRVRTKDGKYIWVEAKAANMFGNKHINGVLVSLRDISDRKRFMEEQSVLADELLKHNKDLQQFSFITSHNLRAPVANLMSLLTLYNHEDHTDEFNKTIIEKFQESTNQLNETLNDLINVLVIRSKPNADLEYTSFNEIIDHVRKNVQGLIDEQHGELKTWFNVEGLEYNKVHLESIFLNLISNAIKYASPERKLQIIVTSEETDNWIRVSVADNGIGIDLNRYGDRIFGLYQRFHANKEGKGLGLYMIKSQITAYGGKIEVESEPGRGTTFIVYFKKQATKH
jgi:PAS domain S-box-containing protein